MDKYDNLPLPVIIPAYNEGHRLAHTLKHLSSTSVKPIVALNGCTDDTLDVVQQFGASYVMSDEQGKLPIIQKSLRFLGKQALNPLIILDADTYPLMPRQWSLHLKEELSSSKQPMAISGLCWFNSDSKLYSYIHSMWRIKNSILSERNHTVSVCGPNLGLNIKNVKTLDQILDLPHLWPGEDAAMVEVIVQNNGVFKHSFSPSSLTLTPLSDSYPPLLKSLRVGKQASKKISQEAYIVRGAPGSSPYSSNKHK
jgi:cellulose synthase/poly-beta-1,6-N-acetylglucosamine synthase-like glycosyltransferase